MPTISIEITNNDVSTTIISSISSAVVVSLKPGQTKTFEFDEVQYGEIIALIEEASQEVLPDGITNRIDYDVTDPRNSGDGVDPEDFVPFGNIVLRSSAQAPVVYETLQAAIDAASAGDEIVLGVTEIQENLTISKDIKISTQDGIPAGSSITGPGGTGATINISSKCEINNVVIKTPSGAVGVTTSHAGGVVNFRTCFFEPQGTGGTCLEHTGNGITRVLADSVIRFNECAIGFDLSGAGRLALFDTNAALMTITDAYVVVRSGTFRATASGSNATQFVNYDRGVRAVGACDIVLQECDFSGSGIAAISIESDTVDLNMQNCDLRGDALDLDVDDAVVGTDCVLRLTNCRASREDMVLGRTYLSNADVSMFIHSDRVTGDRTTALYNELSVGYAEQGFEANFGEGDSYTRGMLVYTETSGGVFADVSTAAGSAVSSTFTFADNAVDSAIYVASSVARVRDGEFARFHGNKYDCTTAGVPGAGRIAIEYWDGTSWTEIEGMVTTDAYPHLSKADAYFEETGSFHLRHRHRVNLLWQANDPMGLGEDYFWKRYRIVDDVYTTPPVFERFKLHGNFTSIGEDGFIEHFGLARVIKRLPIDVSDVQAANNSPGNQDIFFSDVLGVGRIENSFDAGATDRIGISTYLPYDIDTSNGIRFIWSVVSATPAVAGVSDETFWRYRYDVFLDGENVYTSTATAPGSSADERLTEYVGTMPDTANTLTTFSTFIDVRDIIARTGPLGDPPVIAFTLERDAGDAQDTFAGGVELVTFGAFYATWNLGASLSQV